MYLSTFVGNDYLDWKGGDEIFIETPTGSGKTTFVLEHLSKVAISEGREVLLLVNRKILRNQIKFELAKQQGLEGLDDVEIERIKEFDGITVITYQELQENLRINPLLLRIIDDRRFKFIVFDECHYIFQDALFNRKIEYLVRAIPDVWSAAKIFLSATMDEVKPFLIKILHMQNEMIEKVYGEDGKEIWNFRKTYFSAGRIFYYKQKKNYKFDEIWYFREIKTIAEQINRDKTDQKWMIFVNSKAEAQKLKREIMHVTEYLDAEVDEENLVKQQIIREEKFDAKILITTKVLDNGISLKDTKLKNFVLMTTEKVEFIQMLGRKRFVEGDQGMVLFIMARDIKFFNAIRNKKILSDLWQIEKIRNNNTVSQGCLDDPELCSFCQKMAIWENGKIKVSRAAEEKIMLLKEFHDCMVDKLKDDADAFVKEQLAWIGKENNFKVDNYLEVEKCNEKKLEIIDFLRGKVGYKMDKQEQNKFREEFTEILSQYGKRLTDRKTRTAGIVLINRFLKKEGLPFSIESVDNAKFWLIKEEEEHAA